VTAAATLVVFAPGATASGTIAGSLSQCTNGAVGNPITLEQCAGASGGGSVSILNGQANSKGYANWVNGNSNGSKSHWKEGDFIAYRTVINVPAGNHTIEISFDTVHSGGHAIDYLGSYDATETTDTSCPQSKVDDNTIVSCLTSHSLSPFHANYSNPCADLGTLGGGCTTNGSAPTPTGLTGSIPAADITSAAAQNCGGAGSTGNVHNGTFTQIPGAFKIFGPSGSSVGTVSYKSQNVGSGTGQCTTTVDIAFTMGGSGQQTAVLAWGGHIASAADWGVGNSAGAVSGSPYHMSLVSIDGTTLGSQDRALATSAVFFTPSITTKVLNAAGTDVTNTQIPSGTVVHDTATLSNADPAAGGTVTYTLRNDTNATAPCTGTTIGTPQQVTVNNGVVPPSSTFTATNAGSYSYQAVYSGDAQDIPGNFTSPCEPFTVGQNTTSLVTTASPNGTVTLDNTGSPTLKDCAALSGGVSPTGSITFTLKFGGSTVDTETVTVSGNGTYCTPTGYTLPSSGTVTGSYDWTASYTGDTNNKPSSDPGTSAQEQVTVNKANPSLVTTANPNGDVTLSSGLTLKDCAALSGGYNPTGSITFTLTFGGSTVDTETVTVSGNGTYCTPTGYTLPSSGTVTGAYTWTASYTGDGNNNTAADPGTSAQEKVNVKPPTLSLVTTASPNGTVTLDNTGSPTLKDCAALSGGVSPTGSITFTLTFGGSTVDTETVTVSGNGTYCTPTGYTLPSSGTVTGSYDWTASYTGDGNNSAASDPGTSAQEQVTVNKANPSIVTTPGGTVVIGSGTKMTDSATLSGGYNPTGTITFTLLDPSNATVYTDVVTVSGNGTYTTSTGTNPGGYLPTVAGTYHWAVTYSGDGNNNSASSPASAEPETANNPPPVSQITPTQTMCSDFAGGTSATLSQIQYSTKGKTISQVNPGVFFYWVAVNVTSTGSKTFTINQSITTGNFSTLFTSAAGSGAFNSGCSSVNATVDGSAAATTVTFNATTTGTYYIGVKYSTGTVVGQNAPNPTTVHYSFSTSGVLSSTSGLDLVKK
jgi:hypothetical protein